MSYGRPGIHLGDLGTPGICQSGPFGGHATLGDATLAYKLEEESGIRVDQVGGNNLTDNSTVLFNASGKDGNCADFEASLSESLSILDNSDVSVTSDFTWSTWIKAETLGSAAPIIGKDGLNHRDYLIFANTGPNFEILVFDPGGSSCKVVSNETLSTATWYNVVWGWDSSDGKCFVSVDGGTVKKSTGTIASVNDGTSPLYLGSRAFGLFFDGLIDETYFWKRVLTSAERTALQTTFY